jgi:flagellin
MSFGINGIDNFRSIGLDTTTDFLTLLDENLASISNKLTEFGSITNRLESVLDEIEIQYNNLASSRSTIRDADIAEVSSQYIQQQILQQASATLLATANQTPSIALQLI